MMDADIEGDKYGEGRGIQRRGLGPPNSWLRPKRAPNKEEKTEIFFGGKIVLFYIPCFPDVRWLSG